MESMQGIGILSRFPYHWCPNYSNNCLFTSIIWKLEMPINIFLAIKKLSWSVTQHANIFFFFGILDLVSKTHNWSNGAFCFVEHMSKRFFHYRVQYSTWAGMIVAQYGRIGDHNHLAATALGFSADSPPRHSAALDHLQRYYGTGDSSSEPPDFRPGSIFISPLSNPKHVLRLWECLFNSLQITHMKSMILY